jgi:hypothetical protein
LDAEFVRRGRPAIPGRSADLLAQAIESVARQLGIDPAYALRVYIPDDWPTTLATKIVAQLEEHDEAIGSTAPIELSTRSALALANALAVAADWTVRYAASDLMEARHALPATGALHRLAEALEESTGGLVTFGGRPLAEARLALVFTIGKMRTYECECSDHEASDGQPCPTSVMLSGRLIESLHSIGGAMPAPDQQQRNRHPMDDLFEDLGDLR